MKVRISDIGVNGLELNGNLSLESLNQRMASARGNDILFNSAPHVEVTVARIEGGAMLQGQVSATYTQPCARCADDLKRELSIPLSLVLQEINPRAQKEELEDEGTLDDVGICYYEGDQVELDPLIEEQMILSLEQIYRPPCDKSGDCSICGKSPELPKDEGEMKSTINFGDLLKSAEQKSNKKKKTS